MGENKTRENKKDEDSGRWVKSGRRKGEIYWWRERERNGG